MKDPAVPKGMASKNTFVYSDGPFESPEFGFRSSEISDSDANKDSRLEMTLEPTKVTMHEDLVLKKRLTMSTISCNGDKALSDESHLYVDTSEGDVTLTSTSSMSYTIKKTFS